MTETASPPARLNQLQRALALTRDRQLRDVFRVESITDTPPRCETTLVNSHGERFSFVSDSPPRLKLGEKWRIDRSIPRFVYPPRS